MLLSWVNRYDLSKMPERIQCRLLLFCHGTKDAKIDYEDTDDLETNGSG
ncbi:hypothetical protein IW492_15590 [Enterococcus sp. BWB1-3]|nr:hypothetical protein [Enterococcus sp. BWB1-3]MBL1230652.1 hypothetical protein [Enterococcus sp. BWB1-3]MCB5956042.1 hypothetical protein [Enterococcus sp. CWB-B31]